MLNRIAKQISERQNLPDVKASPRGLTWFMGAAIMVNFAMIVFFNLVTYKQLFHSDAAVKSLLAEEIIRTGSFFPESWNVVNGDLFVVFGHLFVIPLLPFFKNGYELHAISGVVSAAILLGTVWWVTGALKLSPTSRLFALAIFSSGVSDAFTESLYGQVSYGVVIYLALALLSALLRAIDCLNSREYRKADYLLVLLLVLLFLVFLANPQRAVATYYLPLMAGLLAFAINPGIDAAAKTLRGAPRVTQMLAAAALTGAPVAGALGHALVLQSANNQMGAGAALFLAPDGIVRNASMLLPALAFQLGAIPTSGIPAVSLYGVGIAARVLATASLIGLMVYLLSTARRLVVGDWRLGFLLAYFLVAFGMVVFIFTFTTTPDASTTHSLVRGSSRYFVPGIAILILIAIYWVDRVVLLRMRAPATGIGIGVAVLSLSMAAYANFVAPSRAGNVSPQQRLASFLVSRGLEYGYASYWNANAVTVLTAGESRVRSVSLDGSLRPFRWLNSNSWFSADAYKGRIFLALTKEEERALDVNSVFQRTGEPVETHVFDRYTIYVFPRNIAEVYPEWNLDFRLPKRIPFGPGTPHQIGRVMSQDRKWWLQSGPQEVGYLAFGPYISVPAGRYRILFDVSGCDNSGSSRDILGKVDIASAQGANVQGLRNFSSGQQGPVGTEFVSSGKGDGLFEFRVYAMGAGCVRANSIELVRVGD